MAFEIERKFLVKDTSFKELALPSRIQQFYLLSNPNGVIRIRIKDHEAFITIKGATTGITRKEFEYQIPLEDALQFKELFKPTSTIVKDRYKITYNGHVWEVDLFFEDNAGLLLAEIELTTADEPFEKPPWVGEEVSANPAYSNSNLAKNPYKNWKND